MHVGQVRNLVMLIINCVLKKGYKVMGIEIEKRVVLVEGRKVVAAHSGKGKGLQPCGA